MYQKKAFNRREQDYAMMNYIMGGDSDAEEESK